MVDFSSRRKLSLAVLGLISVFLITSCLDIDTDIRLKKDGSADVFLKYSFSPDSADFGRGFGADEPWPFPLTEKDFEQQALRVDGVAVRRYRVHHDSDGGEQINVRLKADSIESLSSYLGMDFEIRKSGNGSTMVFNLPSAGNYEKSDPGFRENLEKIIGDSSFRISFRPPSAPITSEPGIIDGRSAVLELPLLDLLQQKNAETWLISW